MKTKIGHFKKLIAILLMLIMAISLLPIPAHAIGVIEAEARGIQKMWYYIDTDTGERSLIPNDELTALIDQGVIPASIDVFYAMMDANGIMWGYESADGRQFSYLLGIYSDPDMQKHLIFVDQGDFGGWSKQTLSQANGWSLSFDKDDIESVFGAFINKYKLNLSGKQIYFNAIEEFIPDGYPLVSPWDFEFLPAKSAYQAVNIYTGEKPWKSIPVTKSWVGYEDGAIPDSVTVSLLDPNGVAVQTIEVTKENDWKGTFKKLPVYADGKPIDYSGYTVSEDSALANNNVSVDGNATDGFTINNTYTTTYGDLTISKSVFGPGRETDRPFNFTVTLSDTTINGTYGDMIFINGVAEFTLKHNESKTAKGLHEGITYAVTEENYSADGYVTTKTGDTGTIVGNEEQTAAFKNTRNTPPPLDNPPDTPDSKINSPQTSDNSNLLLWFSLMCTSGFGILLIVLQKRKRRYKHSSAR